MIFRFIGLSCVNRRRDGISRPFHVSRSPVGRLRWVSDVFRSGSSVRELGPCRLRVVVIAGVFFVLRFQLVEKIKIIHNLRIMGGIYWGVPVAVRRLVKNENSR